jgi:hypothetical protein
MPIRSAVDHQQRLITHTATDPVTFEDMRAAIERQWADQTWTYAVLWDARALAAPMPMSDLRRLSVYIEGVGSGQKRGPAGIFITPSADTVRTGIEFASASARSRELEILLNQGQVDAWLARHAIRRKEE